VDASDVGRPILVDLDGRRVRLGDFASRPVWIVFWATWCAPCQLEATDILAVYHAHEDDGLVVLAIDEQEPAAAVRAYAREHHLDYHIGIDATGAVKTLYGGPGLPTHLFLDGAQVIRDRYVGQMTRELMERRVQAVIGAPAARTSAVDPT
jgi:thiol-disulfide isomerase/thioredoxin